MMSLLSSKVKRTKLMPYKILMCSESNETIIHKLLERFPTSPCPYLCFIVYLSQMNILNVTRYNLLSKNCATLIYTKNCAILIFFYERTFIIYDIEYAIPHNHIVLHLPSCRIFIYNLFLLHTILVHTCFIYVICF